MKNKLIKFIKKYYILFLIPIFVFVLYCINLSSYLPNIYVDNKSTELYTEKLLDTKYKNIENILEIKNQDDYDKILKNNVLSIVIGYLPNNKLSEETLSTLEKESKSFDINFYILDLSNLEIKTTLGSVGTPLIAGFLNNEITFEEVAPMNKSSLETFANNYSLKNPKLKPNNIFQSNFLNSQTILKRVILFKSIFILIILYIIYYLFIKIKNKKVKSIILCLLTLSVCLIYNYDENDYFYNNKNEKINLKNLPDASIGLEKNLENVKINTDYLTENNINYYLNYLNINGENLDYQTLKGVKIIIPNILSNNLDIDIMFQNKTTTNEVIYRNVNNIDDIFAKLEEILDRYNFIKYEKHTIGIINGFTVKEYQGWPPNNPYWSYRYVTAIKYNKNTNEVITITMAPNNYEFEVSDDEYNKSKEIYLSIVKDSKF